VVLTGNGDTWDSFGWYIQIADGGGLWEFQMTGRDGTICMYNRKTTSSGLDTIICGAIDDLFSAPSRILGLSKSLNQESKNVLRCTAVGRSISPF
jgi:hypothetical protein